MPSAAVIPLHTMTLHIRFVMYIPDDNTGEANTVSAEIHEHSELHCIVYSCL